MDPTRADRCGVWLGQEATHRRQRAVQLGCGQATGAWDLGRGSHRMSGQDNYKWIALSNTTIGLLMVTISSTITLISLPQIFNGIGLDPLSPGNTSYFLWLLMGFILVTSVLVVSLGRVGDMFGRVRVYNLGFAIFTVFSILLSVTWMTGRAAALWLVVMRIGQGVGGACLTANSSAILTDAFPINQRGLALGINGVVGIGGSFIGLLLGGLLAPVNWRLVFVVCVPFGVFGTVWAYLKLVDTGVRKPARLDWWGNVTFAVGLISLLTGIVYGIQPYGGDAMGWRNPAVIGAIVGGVVMLAVFVRIEQTVGNPMFNIPLFRIPAFTAGNIANLMASLGRGGLQFMLILWLQGIWLPQHGYSFAQTPLWAGIYLVPLTVGFFLAGPVSGALSDRYGPWAFATSGMVGTAAAFLLLALLPVDFSYVSFALVLLLMGIAQGLFSTPNRTTVMNSLPAEHRGAGAGMYATFQNSAQVLSIGVFFTVVTIGLASTLPHTLSAGLIAHGVPATDAHRVGNEPPIGALFASFLGLNPVKTLVPPAVLGHLSAAQQATLTGRGFFPSLISTPFATGLDFAFGFAVACSIVGALACARRRQYTAITPDGVAPAAPEIQAVAGRSAGPG